MKKYALSLLALLLCFSQDIIANEGSNRQAYLNFCDLVTEAMTAATNPQDRYEYIVNHFEERVGDEDIKDAFDVVYQLNPENRYDVFKQAVEKEIGSQWSCVGLKQYLEQFNNE